MIIEQFLSGFHYGDAIGNSVLRFHRYLKKTGTESRIIAVTIDRELTAEALPYEDYRECPESVKVYHYAIDSPLNEYFMSKKGKRVMVYHNITPSDFFSGFSDELTALTGKGRAQLENFTDKFDLVISDSEFNSRELKQWGYRNIREFPVMIDREEYGGETSRSYGHLFRDGRKNILFVGRVSPNKKIEDLIRFISLYKKNISAQVRLIVAGNLFSVPRYYSSLLGFRDELNLDTGDVFFTGHIRFDELLSVYREADLFLSMSEHEGFCLPLIESSFFGIPVLAYDAGAVAETLDGSGILFREKDMKKLIFLAEKMIHDDVLRERLARSSRERANRYTALSDPEILKNMIGEAFS